MDDTNTMPATRRWSLERASAVFAVVVSLVTLGLLTVQTRLMQAQSRASVWPHVGVGFASNERGFSWVIANNGVGPALIENVVVRLDGRTVENWDALLAALAIDRPAGYYTNQFSGIVLTPAESALDVYTVVSLAPGAGSTAMLSAVDRIAIDVCYCSIFDECYGVSFRQPRPRPVARCDAQDSSSFAQ